MALHVKTVPGTALAKCLVLVECAMPDKLSNNR